MANVLTFTTPLMRRTVGFDRFNDLFESMLEDKTNNIDNFPPYNIDKIGADNYRITMAVAGFSMEDLNIVIDDDTLSISGKHEEISENADKDVEILHRGIAYRAFERSFRLADHIKVTDAHLKDGLLTVNLQHELPEEKKPRMIEINSADALNKLANRKKR